MYHLACQHGDDDEGGHLTQDGDLSHSGSIKPKSKTQQQIDKSRETILLEAFTKVVNLKPVKKISVSTFVGISNQRLGLIFQANSLNDEGREDQLQPNQEANLITNLALIDDILLQLEDIKQQNFRMIVKQACHHFHSYLFFYNFYL